MEIILLTMFLPGIAFSRLGSSLIEKIAYYIGTTTIALILISLLTGLLGIYTPIVLSAGFVIVFIGGLLWKK